jgi:YrhK-like protein
MSEALVARWNSRAHRKRGRGPLTGSTWWAPRALAWWVAILFIIGSACFAIGPLPGYLEAVGFTADATTFFVGSLFFTSAALCQYIEVVVAPVVPGAPTRRRPLGMEFRRIDWWAAAVQLFGTLWFNVTTFSALLTNLDAEQARRYIWMPDVIGSICFLVASELAFAEVGHHWFSWMPKRRSWRITALNLAGSIAFGISAIASFIVPQTGEPISLRWTNLGTFIGAVCFLIGAVLLLPERMHPDE